MEDAIHVFTCIFNKLLEKQLVRESAKNLTNNYVCRFLLTDKNKEFDFFISNLSTSENTNLWKASQNFFYNRKNTFHKTN